MVFSINNNLISKSSIYFFFKSYCIFKNLYIKINLKIKKKKKKKKNNKKIIK
jgi:hypothetical protein